MAGKRVAKSKSDAPPARRKADEDRRESIIKVLVTSDERDTFQTAADAAGMSLSTWLRYIAIKTIKP